MGISYVATTPNVCAEQLLYWLALWRTPGVGPRRFMQLQALFSDLQAVFTTPSRQLSALGLPAALIAALQKPDWAAAEKDLQWGQCSHQQIITYHDPRYPPLLKHIASAPPLLFVQGETAVLATHQLAIVGSRNPSPAGKDNAGQFAHDLSAAGLTITSGLALGVDGISHRSALASGGKTIAVLGSGLDCLYPRSHRQLAEAIAAQGALVSEYPLGTPPKAAHFPQRNRLVGGLSLGVLVVEATLRSGSLITARLAADQGREVFAIPGSIHNPLARGCHFLINQGAKLVEVAQDILQELGALAAVCPSTLLTSSAQEQATVCEPLVDLNLACQQLLDCIDLEATSIDQMVARSGLAAQTVASLVLILELKSKITHVPGGYSRAVSSKCFYG